MKYIYNKISKNGFPLSYVKENALPSWWDEELDNKSMAVLECSGYIASRFGIDLESLLSKDEPLRFNLRYDTKFLQRSDNISNVVYGLASHIASIVAYGNEIDFASLPNNVDEIRKEILVNHKTINLASLVDYCWHKGIPVVHFNRFPKNKNKFDGMIQWHLKSPVIVICVDYKDSAQLAFTLAHELGHLALGHLTQGFLMDKKIKFDSDDREEIEANDFAIKLLLDNCDNCLEHKKIYNNQQLIEYSQEIVSKNPTIDISSVILNYGWHSKNWDFAIETLNSLYPDDNGQILINEYLANQLNWDNFDDNIYEYLEKALGV